MSMKKKRLTYQRPSIERIEIDKHITLVMQTPPQDPTPRGGTKGTPSESDPFSSPFKDSPFG